MGNSTTRLRTIELPAPGTSESDYLESNLSGLEPHIRFASVLEDTFVVSDLMYDYSYLVARSRSHYQLTFILGKGRQLTVSVQPTSDITLVAQKVAERLMKSGTRVRRLALEPTTETYGRPTPN
jgi:hypothetical protein